MATPARYTAQLVIMGEPRLKAHALAAARQEEVSASEACRRWMAVGMAADPATAMPHRLALVEQIETELVAGIESKDGDQE